MFADKQCRGKNNTKDLQLKKQFSASGFWYLAFMKRYGLKIPRLHELADSDDKSEKKMNLCK